MATKCVDIVHTHKLGQQGFKDFQYVLYMYMYMRTIIILYMYIRCTPGQSCNVTPQPILPYLDILQLTAVTAVAPGNRRGLGLLLKTPSQHFLWGCGHQ